MKVALVGADGQLGMALRATTPAHTELHAFTRREIDIVNPEGVSGVLTPLAPDLVINAAAYTRVDAAESDESGAFCVNADGARNLAVTVAALSARLIHVSTDFVFGGERPVPYAVDAPTGPVNVYGRSKLEGERAVIRVLGIRGTVLRTSWLYSRTGTNFVKTMLHAMESRDHVRVVYDQVGSPTWAESLANAVWAAAAHAGVSGIHHWSDDGVASWYDFAVAIQEEALARGLLTRKIPVYPIATQDYPTPARRPRYSVLDKRHTMEQLELRVVHWRDNLRRMLDGMTHE